MEVDSNSDGVRENKLFKRDQFVRSRVDKRMGKVMPYMFFFSSQKAIIHHFFYWSKESTLIHMP
jgi:hypothetical protein